MSSQDLQVKQYLVSGQTSELEYSYMMVRHDEYYGFNFWTAKFFRLRYQNLDNGILQRGSTIFSSYST